MNELDRAAQFLAARLGGDATLAGYVGGRIYQDLAPATASWPVVTFAPLSAPDTSANGATRVLTRILYLIKGITLDDLPQAAAIADRLDALLQGASGPAGSDGYVAGVARESGFSYTELAEGGGIYRHLGGQYRVHIHARTAA